jgi:SAM-dependent methyltransferase
LTGAVNLDITDATRPDVVHDLNERPWPFEDDTFDFVQAIDVLEHLEDTLATMNELFRVCQHGAVVKIVVPHFSSANAFTDPTHRHFFGFGSMDYFTGVSEHDYYTDARFRMLRREIVFHSGLGARVLRRIANRWSEAYERRWAWLFPAWFLVFELEVAKTSPGAG